LKVRYKNNVETTGYASNFNMASVSEVLVQGDWGGDSAFQKDLDVFLEFKQKWKDMRKAFEDHDIITDNYNTVFFEPYNKEDKKRGYTL
jgi:hypothetical protein